MCAAVVALCWVGGSVCAGADDAQGGAVLPASDSTDSPAGSAGSPMEQVLAHERDRETRVIGLARVRVTYPQEVSGALGAMIAKQPRDYDCTTVCDFKGLMGQLEPGLAGAQASLGYGKLVGEKGRNSFFLSDVYVGYGFKAALLRTWSNANLNPPNQTFVGAEAELTFTSVNFSLGWFQHIKGDVGENDQLISAGIGWGF